MVNTEEEAARFLMKATLGADYDTIQRVAQQGITTWLDQQLNNVHVASDSFQQKTQTIWDSFRAKLKTAHGENAIREGDAALPYWFYWRQAWWHRTLLKGRTPASSDKELDDHDLLRHRVAQALSEIVVISDNSNLQLDGVAMASFYDIFYQHAFGSYRDIIQAVSMHPCMGVYLSHMNNQKADPARHIHPDENYAREIMQLFTIGLYELNSDGSRKKDAQGRDIPTYTNRDITELAKVFTGLKAAAYQYEWQGVPSLPTNGSSIAFDDGVSKNHKTIPYVDMINPMVADEAFHDTGTKRLLGGYINLPAGQTTQKDIQDVVTALVAHPNTAPFIAERMIQQLVKSNPSPAYVKAVADAFGTTGDMKAMVRALLLHPEATQSKKLKSPLLRTTQVLRAFHANNTSGKLWVLGERMKENLQQQILASPTVFNFYLPDYRPHGKIESEGGVAPEFALHNSATSIAYVNLMYDWLLGNYYPAVSTVISSTKNNILETDVEKLKNNADDKLRLDFSTEEQLATSGQYNALIERVSLILTGRRNFPAAQQVIEAFDSYKHNAQWVVQTVVFMIAISPEFTVLEDAA